MEFHCCYLCGISINHNWSYCVRGNCFLIIRLLKAIPISLILHLETLLVFLISLHSLILGFAMVFRPTWTLNLFGWDYQGPMFFPTQTGIFLILFGILFILFLQQRHLIWFIIVIKGTAVIFLLSQKYSLGSDAPRTILIAAVFDGLMCLSVTGILILRIFARKQPVNVPDSNSP